MNLRALVENMAFRSRLANIAGHTYGGNRDMFRVLGYKRQLLMPDYRSRFERNEVANRIVKALPNATWRGGAEIWEDQDPNVDTPFELAFEAFDDRLNVWDTFHKTDILSRIYRYGVILIGAPGELETPLEKVAGPDDIAYLTPYAEDDALVQTWESDKTNPRFGLPLFYSIKRTMVPQGNSGNTTSVAKQVHWTRVFPMSDGLLDDRMFGEPALQCVWNRLDDLEKVAGGGAEAFWRRADRGTMFSVDETQTIDDEGKDDFNKQMSDYEHGLKRYLLTRGITPHEMGSDVADFNSPVLSLISLICAGTGIPQRVLMGSEQGKLAAKTDRGNWDDRVSDRRTAYAEPTVRRFLDYLIKLGALPKPVQRFDVEFPELKILDDGQRAEIAGEWASLNKPNEPLVVSRNEIRTKVLGLDTWEEANPDDDGMPTPAAPKTPTALTGKESAQRNHLHVAADRFRSESANARKRRVLRGSRAT